VDIAQNAAYQRACKALMEEIPKHQAGKLGFFGKRKVKKAVNELERLYTTNTDNASIVWFLGKGYQTLGEDSASYDAFKKVCELRPDAGDTFVSGCREAGVQACKLGYGEDAQTYAEMALEITPDDPGLWANKALALLIQKKPRKAHAVIQKSLEISPEDSISKNVENVIQQVISGNLECPARIAG